MHTVFVMISTGIIWRASKIPSPIQNRFKWEVTSIELYLLYNSSTFLEAINENVEQPTTAKLNKPYEYFIRLGYVVSLQHDNPLP